MSIDKQALHDFIIWIQPFFFWYFAEINGTYTLMLLLGSLKVYLRQKELSVEDFTSVLHSNSLPRITMIVPMYNEAKNILPTLHNLRNLTYRYKEIIVVNDGSEDNSLELVKEEFEMIPIPKFFNEPLPTGPIRGIYRSKIHPELMLIDKPHVGKYDAVNAGINACSDPFFFNIDADTWIDDREFEAMIRPILAEPELIGIGASVRIKNGCTLDFNRISTVKFPKNYLPAMQSLEYLRAFLMRQGWDYAGGNIVISGAFAIFPRDLVVKVGGFSPTVALDMEIVVRIHRIMKINKINYNITYLPDPVAWTQGPSTHKALAKQRTNWHRGLMESIWYHKAMLFNPRFGIYAFLNFPFWIWGEILEPVIETLGIITIVGGWWLGFLNVQSVILLLLLIIGFTFTFSIACLLVEELSYKRYPSLRSLGLLLFLSLVELFGYRQMSIWWRLIGIGSFFKRFREIQKESKMVNKLVARCKNITPSAHHEDF